MIPTQQRYVSNCSQHLQTLLLKFRSHIIINWSQKGVGYEIKSRVLGQIRAQSILQGVSRKWRIQPIGCITGGRRKGINDPKIRTKVNGGKFFLPTIKKRFPIQIKISKKPHNMHRTSYMPFYNHLIRYRSVYIRIYPRWTPSRHTRHTHWFVVLFF